MIKKIVDGETMDGKNYLIQPKHINPNGCFHEAFESCDTQVAAKTIISFCREKGGWIPFSKEEINDFAKGRLRFHKLSYFQDPRNERNYIVLGEDGRYRVTHEFIAGCFKASPVLL